MDLRIVRSKGMNAIAGGNIVLSNYWAQQHYRSGMGLVAQMPNLTREKFLPS
jgi:hypothetical protein